jgi:hypothetical protein
VLREECMRSTSKSFRNCRRPVFLLHTTFPLPQISTTSCLTTGRGYIRYFGTPDHRCYNTYFRSCHPFRIEFTLSHNGCACRSPPHVLPMGTFLVSDKPHALGTTIRQFEGNLRLSSYVLFYHHLILSMQATSQSVTVTAAGSEINCITL